MNYVIIPKIMHLRVESDVGIACLISEHKCESLVVMQ